MRNYSIASISIRLIVFRETRDFAIRSGRRVRRDDNCRRENSRLNAKDRSIDAESRFERRALSDVAADPRDANGIPSPLRGEARDDASESPNVRYRSADPSLPVGWCILHERTEDNTRNRLEIVGTARPAVSLRHSILSGEMSLRGAEATRERREKC